MGATKKTTSRADNIVGCKNNITSNCSEVTLHYACYRGKHFWEKNIPAFLRDILGAFNAFDNRSMHRLQPNWK